ncbi:MAG: glutaredoxin family protein [Candidatus Bathyarchaeia archaeon]
MPITKVDGNRKEHKVFLYTLSTCGWCKKTKELLKQKGVAYEYLDVDNIKAEERKAAIEDIQKRNAPLGFPIVIIDDTKLISGYQPDEIIGALGL